MRLSDLIGCDVVDIAGKSVGRISDVHLIQDGPVVDGLQARIRVEALLVGRGGWGERIGYIRGRARGPWLLAVLFRWIERHSQLIASDDVADWDLDNRTVRLLTSRPRAAVRHP